VKQGLFVMAAAAALLLGTLPALAHHAAATYDSEHQITLTGVVTDYVLVSPHTQIFFDVNEKGEVVHWVGLSGPPQRLFRSGWRADSLKKGDKVTITGAPSKDGHKYIGVKKVVGPNGPLPGEGE